MACRVWNPRSTGMLGSMTSLAQLCPLSGHEVTIIHLMPVCTLLAGCATAGAALKIACNCYLAPGSGIKVPTAAIAKYVGLGQETIHRTVSAMEKALISRCQIIPAAKGANQYNITNYTKLLMSVYTLMPKLQQKQHQEEQQQAHHGT